MENIRIKNKNLVSIKTNKWLIYEFVRIGFGHNESIFWHEEGDVYENKQEAINYICENSGLSFGSLSYNEIVTWEDVNYRSWVFKSAWNEYKKGYLRYNGEIYSVEGGFELLTFKIALKWAWEECKKIYINEMFSNVLDYGFNDATLDDLIVGKKSNVIYIRGLEHYVGTVKLSKLLKALKSDGMKYLISVNYDLAKLKIISVDSLRSYEFGFSIKEELFNKYPLLNSKEDFNLCVVAEVSSPMGEVLKNVA